jgi:hypothetical protein
MKFAPTGRVEMTSCAEPFDTVTILELYAPVLKVTVPVGIIVVDTGWTFAVKVTVWP